MIKKILTRSGMGEIKEECKKEFEEILKRNDIICIAGEYFNVFPNKFEGCVYEVLLEISKLKPNKLVGLLNDYVYPDKLKRPMSVKDLVVYPVDLF